ncbi:MAG: class I SAM-dependent methyltransferase, partial [Nitriliruptoraceae bacterium]
IDTLGEWSMGPCQGQQGGAVGDQAAAGMAGIKANQRAYHDWEASNYEDKFSISYDQRCIDYASGRFLKAVPRPQPFTRVLEVGSGTGFFLINLALGGHLGDAGLHASDLSAGMLATCRTNAAAHGVEIVTTVADAEQLPFEDATFDLVVGHAFLHHLPVPALALREMHRVLAPAGTMVIAGEPTEVGSRITGGFKSFAVTGVKVAQRLGALGGTPMAPNSGHRQRTGLGGVHDSTPQDAHPSTPDGVHRRVPEDERLAALEHVVDLHTFRPRDVEHMALLAGFTDVRVITEEFVASWFGWSARTIEAMVGADVLGPGWPWQVLRNYQRLSRWDERWFGRVVPDGWCYNLIVTGRKPIVVE